MLEASDAELVARCRAGDRLGCEGLVHRHADWVRRVCRRFLRSEDAARDAAQDVFTRALDRLETFRGENFAGWLKVIAVNSCLNTIEREKRWAALEAAGAVPSAAPSPDAQLLAAERQAQARRLIERLPQKQKIVFCLKYLDDCSYRDIEQMTGFTANEVKSFLQNARRNFENWWRAEEKGAPWRNAI